MRKTIAPSTSRRRNSETQDIRIGHLIEHRADVQFFGCAGNSRDDRSHHGHTQPVLRSAEREHGDLPGSHARRDDAARPALGAALHARRRVSDLGHRRPHLFDGFGAYVVQVVQHPRHGRDRNARSSCYGNNRHSSSDRRAATRDVFTTNHCGIHHRPGGG
jgi:hypothetical protein